MAIATYARVCAKNVGGNSQIWVNESTNITSITISSGEADAFTVTSNFKEVQAEIDGLIRTQEGTGTGSNISYLHRIEMNFAKMSTELNTLRNSLADGSPCGIVAVVKDGNGKYWLVGWNDTDLGNRGLELRQDNDTSGGAPTDEEGGLASLVLETTSGYLDVELSAAGITSFNSAKDDA